MKIALIVIGCFLVGMGIGVALGGSPVDCSAPDTTADIDYLISCMERARDSHQQFLDMPPVLEVGPITINEPATYYLNRISPYTTLEDQQRWVEIYDDILEILRDLK